MKRRKNRSCQQRAALASSIDTNFRYSLPAARRSLRRWIDSYFQIEKSKNKCIGISRTKKKNPNFSSLFQNQIRMRIQGCLFGLATRRMRNACRLEPLPVSRSFGAGLCRVTVVVCGPLESPPGTQKKPPRSARLSLRIRLRRTKQSSRLLRLLLVPAQEACAKLSQPKLAYSVFRTHATICCFTTTTTTTRRAAAAAATTTSRKYFRHLFLENF